MNYLRIAMLKAMYLTRSDPAISGIKILNWELVISFLRDASFPSSHFTSYLHFLALSVWLCLFNPWIVLFHWHVKWLDFFPPQKFWPVIKKKKKKTKCFKFSAEKYLMKISFFCETHCSQNFPLFEKSVFHQKHFHQRVFLPAFYSVCSPANSYWGTTSVDFSQSCTPVIESRIQSVLCKVFWMDKILHWLKC